MKNLLIIFSLFFITSVFGGEYNCTLNVGVNTQVSNGKLISVNKKNNDNSYLECKKWTVIRDGIDLKILAIESNAFNNDLKLNELTIITSNTPLQLNQDSFAGLKELELLGIYAHIESSDNHLFQLVPNIETLDLLVESSSANFIMNSLADLKNLKVFKFHEKSEIKSIDFAQFFKATPLITELTFSYTKNITMNNLSQAPLKNLKKLNILYSPFDEIYSGVFDGFIALESVTIVPYILDYQTINIKNNVFNTLPQLKKVFIHNSRLIIDDYSFDGLNLEILDISHNYFNAIEINEHTFKGLTVDNLDVSSNDGIKIKENAFKNTIMKKLNIKYCEIPDNFNMSVWGFETMPEIII